MNIASIVEKHDLVVIACSFGRDSMVVLHMAVEECRKQDKPFKIIWNDTGVEYPEQYEFNKMIIEKWNLKENLIIAKSEEWTFWKLAKEFGMPIAPRDSRDRDMQKATQNCCKYLKKEPTKKALKQFEGINYVYLTGLTAEESRNRMASAKKYGNYFYSKTWKHYKFHPILWWSDEEIDSYIRENEIPLCKIYTYTDIMGYKIRNGCWCCPQAWKFGKGKWLKRYYPKLYKYLVTKTPLGDYIITKKLGIIDGQTSFFSKEDIFEMRPCFFEKYN